MRCQVVYRPRRYRSSPWLAEYSRFGKFSARKIAGRLDRVHAGTAEPFAEQPGNVQGDIADVLGVHAEAVLTRQQPVLGILVLAGSRSGTDDCR